MKVASVFGLGDLLAAMSPGLPGANAISFPVTSRPYLIPFAVSGRLSTANESYALWCSRCYPRRIVL